MHTTVTRRTALAAGAVGLGAVTLAACSSGSSAAPAAGGGGAADPRSDSESGGSSPGPTSGTSAGNSGKALAALSDIPVGEAVAAKLADGSPAIVAQPTAGTAACFSAVCTHMGCTVNPAGKELHCPCHGSVYDAVTGAVKSGPAPKPLPKIAVHVDNGEVIAG